LFYYFQLLLQKKVYYTEDFKELSTAEGAAYYSTYENEKALLEALILLMEQNAITINFQISKNVF
jgi:hypothetical protein